MPRTDIRILLCGGCTLDLAGTFTVVPSLLNALLVIHNPKPISSTGICIHRLHDEMDDCEIGVCSEACGILQS